MQGLGRAAPMVWLLMAACSSTPAPSDPSGAQGVQTFAGTSGGVAGAASGMTTAGRTASGGAGVQVGVAGAAGRASAGAAGAAGVVSMVGAGASAGGVGAAGVVSAAGAGAAGSAAAGSGAAGSSAAGSSSAAGGSATGNCSEPPAASQLTGWAAVAGMGLDVTSGGGTQPPQIVTSLSMLTAAVSGDAPAVIYVRGVLSPGSLRPGSNKTIVGLCGAEFHGHIEINGVSNLVVRNLKVVGYGVGKCSLDPKYTASEGCSSGDDAITVQHAHHIWFDHCDVSDGTDGNLDITNGADFVTVSWTKFHYTPRTDNEGNDSTGAAGHRFSNLIGGADGVAADVGHLNVTWHHDWWADNVMERMPRTRAGKIHVYNNLFTSTGNNYCTNAGAQATLLVEGNVYSGVKNPLKPDSNGDMLARDNVFMGTSGTMAASGQGFMPSYPYMPEPAAGVEAVVRSGAGPH